MAQRRWLCGQVAIGQFIRSSTIKRRSDGRRASDQAADKAFGYLHAIYDELAANGEPEFGDIWVQQFAADIDGIRYELRYKRREDLNEDERYECVMFWPWDIMFHPPWDSGAYST